MANDITLFSKQVSFRKLKVAYVKLKAKCILMLARLKEEEALFPGIK